MVSREGEAGVWMDEFVIEREESVEEDDGETNVTVRRRCVSRWKTMRSDLQMGSSRWGRAERRCVCAVRVCVCSRSRSERVENQPCTLRGDRRSGVKMEERTCWRGE